MYRKDPTPFLEAVVEACRDVPATLERMPPSASAREAVLGGCAEMPAMKACAALPLQLSCEVVKPAHEDPKPTRNGQGPTQRGLGTWEGFGRRENGTSTRGVPAHRARDTSGHLKYFAQIGSFAGQ